MKTSLCFLSLGMLIKPSTFLSWPIMDFTCCAPLSMAQRIRYKFSRTFNILTAAWKRSGCFFPSWHVSFAWMVFTFHFSFPLCAIFAGSEQRWFFPPQPLFSAALVCSEFHALLTLMANEMKTKEICSGIGSVNLKEESSRWLPVPGML